MDIPFDIKLPDPVSLKTQNLSCVYEQGSLRYIKYGNIELVRMIYSAVRDHNWGTVPFSVVNEKIVQYTNSFIVWYTVKYSGNGIEYEAAFSIEGNENDTISFTMEGKALNDFMTNRIGLCVHLPVEECRNETCTLTDADNKKTNLSFPEQIAPHQPFTGIQQMQWRLKTGADIMLRFSGDIFEAEDQRNWMDHSYKIYSRPLSLPFPFKVKANDTIQQAIQMHFSPPETEVSNDVIKEDDEQAAIPALGIAAADEPALLTAGEIALLRKLPFVHYRAEVDFENNWKQVFEIHCANAKALNAKLELVLFFTDAYIDEAGLFAEALCADTGMVKTILPQHKQHKVTPVLLQKHFYPLMKNICPEIQVGYGTDIYFTELNRQRPENDLYDFVSFSLNPQVHSFDAKTMLENINTIPDIVATIRSFTNKPIVVSPVTFRKRKNHDGAGLTRHDVVNNFDERQNTWFGAGWFLLCLYALRNMQQVSFFKTTGDSGMINGHGTTPLFRVLERLKTFDAASMGKKNTEITFANKTGETLVFDIADH